MTTPLPQSARQGLEDLNFNPLEKMVEYYHSLEDDIVKVQSQPRFSHVAVAQLRSSQQQTLKTLMEYAFVKARPEDSAGEIKEPLRIVLEYDNDTKTTD
jgi:hypothetical protein